MTREKRVQGRVRVLHSHMAVRVGGELLDGDLQDLALGGALVRVARDVPPGSRVELLVPTPAGEEVTVSAEVVRTDRSGGGSRIAVRFDADDPSVRRPLLDILHGLLLAGRDGMRSKPRLSRRLAASLVEDGNEPVRRGAVVEDLSAAGMLLTFPDAPPRGPRIAVEVEDPAGGPSLRLRCGVVRRWQDGAIARVGAELVDPSAADRLRLDEILLAAVDRS